MTHPYRIAASPPGERETVPPAPEPFDLGAAVFACLCGLVLLRALSLVAPLLLEVLTCSSR